MVRKAAPQPLTLSDPSNSQAQDPRPGETLGQIHSPTSASAPATSTSSPLSALSASSALSAPKSPRSPFRFTPKKSLLGKSSTAYPPADDLPCQSSPSSPQAQQNHGLGVSSFGSGQTFSPRQNNHVHGADDDDDDDDNRSPFLPLAATLATLHDSVHSPASDPKSLSPGHQHHRSEDAARGPTSPKSSGFFFNFHKPSKSSQQLPTPTALQGQSLQHPHHAGAGLAGEGSSRGTDNSAMTGKSSKYPGTAHPVSLLFSRQTFVDPLPSPGFIYPAHPALPPLLWLALK
jgi:hypothetical protein